LTDRKAFLLRLDPALHDALQRWAGAELRSLTAQIEYLLRKSLHDARRMPPEGEQATGNRQQEGQG
jgi:hypothetical protein